MQQFFQHFQGFADQSIKLKYMNGELDVFEYQINKIRNVVFFEQFQLKSIYLLSSLKKHSRKIVSKVQLEIANYCILVWYIQYYIPLTLFA